MTRQFVVEADGGSRGNPGPAGYGALVRDAQTGEVLTEIAESLGRATNNVAEYSGLVAGLRAAADLARKASPRARAAGDASIVLRLWRGYLALYDGGDRPFAEMVTEFRGRCEELAAGGSAPAIALALEKNTWSQYPPPPSTRTE